MIKVRLSYHSCEKYNNLHILYNAGVIDLNTLHERLKEACVRKSQKDADVAPYLPDALYKEPLQVILDRKSAKLYSRILSDLLIDLDDAQTLFGANFNLLAHYGYESQWNRLSSLQRIPGAF